MDEPLRKELLDRVNSRTATIGASVPDTVSIDGTAVDLSEFIVETLADEIVGIDRALNALDTIRHPDFADEHQSAALDGHERWLSFVDAVQ